MTLVLATGRNDPILARQPERLLVEGFRHWLNGYATGSIDCWELGWALYARELGPRDARRLLAELSFWVRETRDAASRPLGCFPYGSCWLCRDECLALSLVAAAQHGDRDALRAAAGHLADGGPTEPLEGAAAAFAEALQSVHQQLLPVPSAVIDTVARHAPMTRFN
ncbi:hypothetical protein [Chthonobacter rhizosphaerae]|uniref:hypothetical protein n=1 Tax=Chthonobacter rhizosphaerae TaxID=2735553 RepID=UPI0015EEDF77|nr:hypothetical protein [Chthonobacter rhizosphaerae]